MMGWVRGDTIGRGSFGTISLAIPISQNSSLLVTKSSEFQNSITLKNEKQILSILGNNHPSIIKLLGDSLTCENGTNYYNLFLEYAIHGSLADHGKYFETHHVKNYTKSILEGLCYIHEKGFVHCDIKLQNILLFSDGRVKIADFGLAKRASEKMGCRGTPLYMSPEIVSSGEGESPADVWALGCAVVEMVTGKCAWEYSRESGVNGLFYRVGVAGESPVIPDYLCSDGKDFLHKCFVKDPNERWTTRMLLDHPFLSGLEGNDDTCELASVSPRCPFDFSDSESIGELSSSLVEIGSDRSFSEPESHCWSSVSSRFEQQFIDNWVVPDWSDEDSWFTVR